MGDFEGVGVEGEDAAEGDGPRLAVGLAEGEEEGWFDGIVEVRVGGRHAYLIKRYRLTPPPQRSSMHPISRLENLVIMAA